MNTGVISNIFPSDSSVMISKNLCTQLIICLCQHLNYASNLNTGKVIYNNQQLFNSFIISAQASSDGKKKTKGSFEIKFRQYAIA